MFKKKKKKSIALMCDESISFFCMVFAGFVLLFSFMDFQSHYYLLLRRFLEIKVGE